MVRGKLLTIAKLSTIIDLAFINNTTATNAMTVPITMIAMTTPMIAYTGPGPLSMLESLLREDTGPIFVVLDSSANVEVSACDSEVLRGIEVRPFSSSDEKTGDTEVIPLYCTSDG